MKISVLLGFGHEYSISTGYAKEGYHSRPLLPYSILPSVVLGGRLRYVGTAPRSVAAKYCKDVVFSSLSQDKPKIPRYLKSEA